MEKPDKFFHAIHYFTLELVLLFLLFVGAYDFVKDHLRKSGVIEDKHNQPQKVEPTPTPRPKKPPRTKPTATPVAPETKQPSKEPSACKN